MTKSEVRKEILRKLKTQNEKLKTKKDKLIREKLLSLPEFKQAKVVAFYESFRSEVDTKKLIDEALTMGKRVVVPVIVGDDLKLSEIKERIAQASFKPFPKEDVDLIIVPGVAFDKKGTRLGRGKGFYDRFLKTLPRRIKRIGLAYDLQIIKDLPTAPQDSPVDMVITN